MCLCFILQKLKDQCTIFESDISICVAQSQKTFGNQGLLTEVKKISPLSMIGKITLHIGKKPSKARPWLASVIRSIL